MYLFGLVLVTITIIHSCGRIIRINISVIIVISIAVGGQKIIIGFVFTRCILIVIVTIVLSVFINNDLIISISEVQEYGLVAGNRMNSVGDVVWNFRGFWMVWVVALPLLMFINMGSYW